jgi:hypothetical protein
LAIRAPEGLFLVARMGRMVKLSAKEKDFSA